MIVYGCSNHAIVIQDVHVRRLLVMLQNSLVPCVDGLFRVMVSRAEREALEGMPDFLTMRRPVPTARIFDLRDDPGAFAVAGCGIFCEQERN